MRQAQQTKGKSKITAQQVVAARRLFKANPELTMQQIKDKLKLRFHVVMVGRAIRGITHRHLDMCGLPVRPFGTKKAKPAPAKKAPAKKKPAPVRKPTAVPRQNSHLGPTRDEYLNSSVIHR